MRQSGQIARRARPVIELILQAERALSVGLLDQAERLYRQAADLDPRNSIAVVGLARVALDRGDDGEALRLADLALGIDPENAAAARLAERLREVRAFRGEGPTADAPAAATAAPEQVPAPPREPVPEATAEPTQEPAPEPEPEPAPKPAAAPRRRSLLDRLRRRG